MKYALIAATLAIVSGSRISLVQNVTANASRNATGVTDESYDTHQGTQADALHAHHLDMEGQRKSGVDSQAAEDAWRGVRDPKFFQPSKR